jgi:hypothetical protein
LPQNGVRHFYIASNGTVPIGAFATATITDPAGNTSEFSRCKKIKQRKPGYYNLLAPKNNQALKSVQVKLDWQDAYDADSYSVTVRADSPTGKIVDENVVTASEYTSLALSRGQTFFWRIKACNTGGCRKSAWWSFSIKP